MCYGKRLSKIYMHIVKLVLQVPARPCNCMLTRSCVDAVTSCASTRLLSRIPSGHLTCNHWLSSDLLLCLQLSHRGWEHFQMARWRVTCLELTQARPAAGRRPAVAAAKAGLEACLAVAAVARPLRSADCSFPWLKQAYIDLQHVQLLLLVWRCQQ